MDIIGQSKFIRIINKLLDIDSNFQKKEGRNGWDLLFSVCKSGELARALFLLKLTTICNKKSV